MTLHPVAASERQGWRDGVIRQSLQWRGQQEERFALDVWSWDDLCAATTRPPLQLYILVSRIVTTAHYLMRLIIVLRVQTIGVVALYHERG